LSSRGEKSDTSGGDCVGEIGEALSSTACCELIVVTLVKGRVRLKAFLTLPTRAQLGNSGEGIVVSTGWECFRNAGWMFCSSGLNITVSIESNREKQASLSTGLVGLADSMTGAASL